MVACRSVQSRRKNARRLLCAAASVLVCSSCSVTRTDAPSRAPESGDFQKAIARVERSDPGSPSDLLTQLSYADFLVNGASGPACAQRLKQAEELLVSVNASPKATAMFPDGWAHAVDVEYRLHLARADCGGSDVNEELRTAVSAARRAAELYRNTFDYPSMVIMQFDAAVLQHRLGKKAAALSALESVLEMDREYGFEDDARENYSLLLTWRGEPADDSHVARLMQDFPKRKVTLTFGWRGADLRMRLENQRVSLEGGRILRSRASASFERRIVADAGDGWNVSYYGRLTGYEPGVWPSDRDPQENPTTVFTALPLPVGFKVSVEGEFGGVTDSAEFSENLLAKTAEIIRTAMPSGQVARDLADQAIDTAGSYLSPGALEAATGQNYQLDTAMWIGATLEQGLWQEISAPLSLPGMPRVVVQNRVQFAFTRRVPCTAHERAREGAHEAAHACAEIVIRATPEKGDLDQIISDFVLPGTGAHLHNYTASIEARIVVDPMTLLSYAREERLYWYVSLGKGPQDTLIRSEHLTFGADPD
jgi:hypothetical protein